MSFFRRTHLPWLATALGIIATLGAFRVASLAEEDGLRAEFERRSQVIGNTIDLSLRMHEDTLYSLRNLFHYSEQVSREEFAGAADELVKRHTGIQALEWVERTPGDRRAAVEAAVRAEGFPNFQFSDRGGGPALQRAPDRPEHFPVLYVHPYDLNQAALGFDLVAGRTWPDMLRAAETNTLVASGRLPLITNGLDEDWGYLFELPVYHLPVPAAGPQRREQLRGFVLGLFRLTDVIEGSIAQIDPQARGLDLLILDGRAPTERQFLHYHNAEHVAGAAIPTAAEILAAPLHRLITLSVPGRTWHIYLRATPEWLAEQRRHGSLFVLLAGLGASVLVGFFLRTTLRRTELVEQEVATRTLELRAAQQLLQDDIRQRQSAEAELQENRRQLTNLISQLPGAAFRCLFDDKLTALFASEGMQALTGYPPDDFTSARRHLAQLTVPADRPAVRAAVGGAIQGRRPFEVEYRLVHRDGTEKWVLVRGRPIYDETGALRFLEGLAIDVTALKLAESDKITIERKLLAAQKLESLGVLAGGIAHDFNNILTSVLANASLARHDAGTGQPVDRSLQQIEIAARRAADLCQQMLAYAGKGKIVTDRVDLSELVRGTAALLEVTLSKSTKLDLRLATSLPPVLADPTQLRQIVMNLVINGADAITGPTGLITLTTFTRPADASLLAGALGHPDLPPGIYAGLEVTDNGSGMTPETIARIFEPFFTTKFSGRGLGPSAVLGIVQSHRGALFVESHPGRGSTFRLLLPATTGPAVLSTAPFPAAVRSTVLRGTVLIVDDEPAVSSIAATVLQVHGATPLTAASGDAALALLRTHPDPIALVLLDLTMPGLSGEETLRRMRATGAKQPVILMSGYSETETMQHSADLGVASFMQKPFEIETLLAKVKPFLS